MPLARIVTEFPDEAVELAMRLRSRGFQVETVSPKTTSKAAADLEVRLEECAVEDMLTQATEIAAGEEVCVFVAPGALEESARFEGTFSASFAFAGPVKREFAPVEEDEDESFPQDEPLPEMEEPNISLASAPVELADSVDSVLPDETGEHNAAIAANAEIAETVPQITISEVTAPAATAQPVIPESLGAPKNPRPKPTMGETTQQAAAEAFISAPPPQGRYGRETSALIETARSSESAPQATSAGTVIGERSSNPVLTMPQFARTRPVVGRSRSRAEADRAFWRIAVVSAALATLVVLVGTVWHRARPTPANLEHSAGQQLPFHEPAKKAAVLPIPPKNAPIQSQAAAGTRNQSNASAPAPTAAPEGTRAASIVVPSSAVQRLSAHVAPAPHKQAHSGDGGIIAEDTVIFYDRKPSASSGSHPQPAVK